MRVLIVPLAAATIFATATYSSATMTGSASDKNVLYAGAGYQLPADMKVPALSAGVKIKCPNCRRRHWLCPSRSGFSDKFSRYSGGAPSLPPAPPHLSAFAKDV